MPHSTAALHMLPMARVQVLPSEHPQERTRRDRRGKACTARSGVVQRMPQRAEDGRGDDLRAHHGASWAAEGALDSIERNSKREFVPTNLHCDSSMRGLFHDRSQDDRLLLQMQDFAATENSHLTLQYCSRAALLVAEK